MSAYDARAWEQLQRWKAARRGSRLARVVPGAMRDRAGSAARRGADAMRAVPGFSQFEQALVAALGGLNDLSRRVAGATVPTRAVVEAFRRNGHEVSELSDLQKLELQILDRVRPRLDLRYVVGGAAERAAAGFAIAGGELLIVAGGAAGAGVGAAPGAGVVVGAMAADAAAVLVASHRAVAHVGAYYGYDPNLPEEQLFALGVLGAGTATEAGKAAAFAELNKVVQGLARRHTWKQLNEHAVSKIIGRVYAFLGFRLTQRKLGQAIPVAGVVIGAGLNAQLLGRVVDTANMLYRERYLREKYGLDWHDDVGPIGEDQALRVADIVDAELVDDADADGSPKGDSASADESGEH